MVHSSSFVAAAGGTSRASSVTRIREDWRLAREAYKELQLRGAERSNLLLVGGGAVPMLLEMLGLDGRAGVIHRRPGDRCTLPSPWGGTTTLVLHDIHELTASDQDALLRWLDEAAGKIRTISTTDEPLWPRVKRGEFNDVLYYRLNVVYVDVGVSVASQGLGPSLEPGPSRQV